jgi:hypothetical protein
MTEIEIKKVKVKGKNLVCPVCSNDEFWRRTTLMNTSGMTFMGWDWLNREGENFICSNCGYVFWFFDKDQRSAEDPKDAGKGSKASEDEGAHMDDPRLF